MMPCETPKARFAHQAVQLAIKSGELRRQPCEVCGESRTDAHHDSYDKPLDVRFLCARHHRQRHAQLNAPRKPAKAIADSAARAEREQRLVNIFLTRKDLAKRHQITTETVKRRQAKGIYAPYKIGRSVLYKLSDIVAFENAGRI